MGSIPARYVRHWAKYGCLLLLGRVITSGNADYDVPVGARHCLFLREENGVVAVTLELLTGAPAPVLITLLAFVFGPTAVLTLLAGVVAVLTDDSERGRRAIEVLRLIRHPRPRHLRRRDEDEPEN